MWSCEALFDSRLFLEIANKILSDRDYHDESAWRTAIGRAYYAAFLATMKRLQSLGSSFTDKDRIHWDVIQELMERDSGLGNQLDQLRERRLDADYRMDCKITKDLGQKYARLSERIINSIDQLT